MRNHPVSYLLLVLVLVGCRSMDADKLVLNPGSHVYETRHGGSMVPLRLNSGELVDSERFDLFRIELAAKGNRYPFSLRKEPSVLLKRSDWALAACFDSIHRAITDKDYNRVFVHVRTIRSIYPQADLYSNLAFLEGYAFEQLGLDTEAKKSYSRFLNYSSQTFSELQRGYGDADPGDSIYLEQRNAARQFVNGNRAMHVFDFPPIPPKHHIIPNQPGFLGNTAVLSKNRLSAGISLGKDYYDELSLGLRLSRPLSTSSRLMMQAEISRNTASGTLGLPIQLFCTHDNSLGLKLSPFLTYSYLLEKSDINQISNERSYVNGGIQLSAGYFLQPNLSLGGVYTYHLRDLPHPVTEAGSERPFGKNDYDLSLYWGLLDNLALKAGAKNDDIVLGCFLSGWEISWSLNHQHLILSTTLF